MAPAYSCCGLWRSTPHCGALSTESGPTPIYIYRLLYHAFRVPSGNACVSVRSACRDYRGPTASDEDATKVFLVIGSIIAEVCGRERMYKAMRERESSRPRLLLENALHNAGANAQLPADLEDAVTVGPQLQYSRLHRGLNPASPEFCAIRPGASKPSIDSFPNDSPLKLSEYPKHLNIAFPAVVEVSSPCW